MSLRTDQSLIAEWIKPRSRVLDLGCGDGTLMAHLQEHQEVKGYGLEIDEENIVNVFIKALTLYKPIWIKACLNLRKTRLTM